MMRSELTLPLMAWSGAMVGLSLEIRAYVA
jgi:hypothetical protein